MALNFQQLFKSLKIANLEMTANLKKKKLASIIMTVISCLKSCRRAFFCFEKTQDTSFI